MSRQNEDRHFAVVQCFAFLREYGNLRGHPQVTLWTGQAVLLPGSSCATAVDSCPQTPPHQLHAFQLCCCSSRREAPWPASLLPNANQSTVPWCGPHRKRRTTWGARPTSWACCTWPSRCMSAPSGVLHTASAVKHPQSTSSTLNSDALQNTSYAVARVCIPRSADGMTGRPCCDNSPCSAEHGPGPGVRREAAHNLALIYQRSGAPNLARNVLRAHFTV